MNIDEFTTLYSHLGQKSKVAVTCRCRNTKTINKEKASENIKKFGEYRCRSCCVKQRQAENPPSENTKKKQSDVALGRKKSDATKKLMSEKKREFYQTEKGKAHCKKLSKLASKNSNKLNKSKRKVLYISAKNNGEVRICNSSYEFVACHLFLEKDTDITSYETQVPYEVGGRSRSLDILISYANGKKKAVEVKPKKQLEQYANQIKDSATNAKTNGYDFTVWTEDDLNIKRSEEATKLADEYRLANYLIDFAAYRLQKRKARSKRHYQNKVKDDKVIIFCAFCGTYHSRLKKLYEKNIKKNGRFICIRENGHITGKKDKPHLKNPLEAEGKKQCSRCKKVLTIVGNFSTNGAGKIASRCKKCRAEVAKGKYNGSKGR
jgi:hypothetical protein